MSARVRHRRVVPPALAEGAEFAARIAGLAVVFFVIISAVIAAGEAIRG
jgi:hypothetical protein